MMNLLTMFMPLISFEFAMPAGGSKIVFLFFILLLTLFFGFRVAVVRIKPTLDWSFEQAKKYRLAAIILLVCSALFAISIYDFIFFVLIFEAPYAYVLYNIMKGASLVMEYREGEDLDRERYETEVGTLVQRSYYPVMAAMVMAAAPVVAMIFAFVIYCNHMG